MNLKVFIPIIVTSLLFLFGSRAFAQANKTVSNGQTVSGIDFSAMGECVFNWTNSNPAIGLAAGGTGNIPSFKAINNGTTPITATINVTPVNKGFAYIAYSATNSVAAVNTLTNTVSTEIPVGKAPGLVGISPDQSRVYILNPGDSTISVINTITNTVINTFHIPASQPNSGYTSITVSLDGSKLLVAKGSFIYAFDAVTGQLLNTSDTKGSNESGALSLDGTTMFIAGGINIGLYDVKSLSASQPRTPSYPGYKFDALKVLVSKDGTKLYVLDAFAGQPVTIWVLDIQTLQPLKVVELSGSLTYFEMAQSSDGRYLYVNTVDNVLSSYLTVVDMTTYNPLTNIPIPYFVTAMSIAPNGNLLYLEARSVKVTIIDTKLNTITGSITLTQQPGSAGDFVTGNCDPFSYTVTVYPNPVITTAGNLPALSTVYGKSAASGSFNVSGSYITGGIIATPPTGFEISADNITFGKSITIAADNTGVVTNAPVYIRLAKTTPVGTYSGNVTLTYGNTTTTMNQPQSTVTPAPLIITADNKTQFYGLDVPPLTATYKGFVNNDTIPQLAVPPIITTIATAGSAAGQYPITASGAVSPNYAFTYFPGVLTVLPLSAITIPNTFTPNGDGINDTWNIKLINNFPDFTVQIFNRYGQRVFYSHNYPNAWDGTYKNSPLPFGVYYYLIALGRANLSGYVAIVR